MEEVSSALQSILAHKMRTILTMLGVIIGIASIITIFSIIEGNTEKSKTELIGGSNNTIKITYNTKSYFDTTLPNKENPITPNSIPKITNSLKQEILKQDGVKDVLENYIEQSTIYHLNTKATGTIYASTNKLLSLKSFEMIKGKKLSDEEFKHQITYVNESMYSTLFPNDDGLGKYIEINGVPFKVVGVYRDEDENAQKYSVESSAIIPISEREKVFEKVDLAPEIILQTNTTDQLKIAAEKVSNILNSHIPKSDYVYGIINFNEFEQQLEQFNQSSFILLTGIASISLIVGGIGVMNIMLVSVTERTREIGVKKALGARRVIILRQFLYEAILMTILGGMIGIIIGLLTGYIITYSLKYPYIVSYSAIIISLVFCCIIGVVFGLLPAMKASKLDPIDALRYE